MQAVFDRLEELTRECIRLRDEVRALHHERQRLMSELRQARHDLGTIHGSRMWRVWMASLAARRIATWPFSVAAAGLAGALRVVRHLGKATARGLAAGIRFVPRATGTVVLEAGCARLPALAALRRGVSPPPREDAIAPAGERPPRVLIVMPYPIHPPNHGGGVRLYNLVRRLSQSCDVHLLIYSQRGEDPEQRAALERLAVRVDFHHWQPRHRPDAWGLTPPNAQLFDSERARSKLRDLVLLCGIDVVQLEYAELGQLASAVPDGVPVILTEHDIAFRQHQRRHALNFGDRFPESRNFGASRADLLRLLRYELGVCARADQVHTMSAEDGRFLSRFLPQLPPRTWVVPNGVDCDHYDPGEAPHRRAGVLYVGNYQNLPNVDALEYFVEDIWPLVRLRCPEARLTVVGANAGDRIRRLGGRDGITVDGTVPDLRPYYHGYRLMVAPIRAGSGTRLKILEAFAAGLPVVSSALGAEGIEYTEDVDIVIRDQPAAFAAAVVELLDDDHRCRELARNARRLAEERYDWRPVSRTLERSYHVLNAATPASSDCERPPAPLLQPDGAASGRRADVSVIIPTWHGGDKLASCLTAIRSQRTGLEVEIVCVDSGSRPADLEVMREHGAIVHGIEQRHFDHGLTRDLGARLAAGRWLVFLNQDAIPVGDDWLEQLLEPFRADPEGRIAAVQGGIREIADPLERFYWDSCGERFYFTRESHGWMGRYGGLGFSTVHCAIRRDVWQRYPFGSAPIMEDKKWQREIVAAGYEIVARHDVPVQHTHNYDLRGLLRRCASEGYGWRLIGERYRLRDMLSDMRNPGIWADRRLGLQHGGIRTGSEKWFPLLRPAALWWGNRIARRVLH